MKSIIISIKPEHALNILNGLKTLELRKSVPKDFVGWVYGYVTKGGKLDLIDQRNLCVGEVKKENTYALLVKPKVLRTLNGTIPFRFWFDEYEELDVSYSAWTYAPLKNQDIIKQLCLTSKQIEDYSYNGITYKDLYAWHIKKLDIFDKPMALGDFNKIGHEAFTGYFVLTRPPQSWQYVWVRE
jgi:predicted transcriptional regulator